MIYKSLGLVDKSTAKQHAKHIHTSPVPRGGGIPIFFAMLFATLTLVRIVWPLLKSKGFMIHDLSRELTTYLKLQINYNVTVAESNNSGLKSWMTIRKL